ncbi:hypothetical protein BBBOND_0209420 [Babesia bigemina]|uniref:Uncharacterized protein n=1 Tax=Babesia bigemina TaxID=5866 RepID=A0A061DA84_BABBI|nr:hypothetical protein BBBOND_0209420 [Babesia bigemina]CDR95789.1 hypothetical protein BBBOND_0209420 [Babesia bigemina]|eukprot:XP_012767975.1 hypothetical protein BBBOND_0209420 [Babesia bigemina]
MGCCMSAPMEKVEADSRKPHHPPHSTVSEPLPDPKELEAILSGYDAISVYEGVGKGVCPMEGVESGGCPMKRAMLADAKKECIGKCPYSAVEDAPAAPKPDDLPAIAVEMESHFEDAKDPLEITDKDQLEISDKDSTVLPEESIPPQDNFELYDATEV